jgi:hypothetical protein
MQQEVVCRPVTADAWVHALVRQCSVCGKQSGTEIGFFPSSFLFPCQYHSTKAVHTNISSAG